MEPWFIRITDFLLAQSWQIAILAGVVAAASFLLRNRSAHIRYLLWLIVLAKCLVPPLYTIPVAVLPQEEPPAYTPTPPMRETMVAEQRLPEVAKIKSAGPTIAGPEVAVPIETIRRPTRYDMRACLAIGWLAGAVALAFYNFLNGLRTHVWLQGRRRGLPAESRAGIANFCSGHGVKHVPRLWLLDGISQPFVWGLVRGTIYLPAELLDARHAKFQASLLTHELSHVMRFDAMVNSLQVIAQMIFWFHPLVWWMNRKIRAEREKCCDEMTIVRLHALPEDYSEAIVETIAARYESARPVPSLAVAGQARNIEERIRTMLKPGKTFCARPSLAVIVIVSMVSVLTAPTVFILTAAAQVVSPSTDETKITPSGKLDYVDHLVREDLFGAASIEISPDGRHGYAAAYEAGALTVFKRDRDTGLMQHVQTLSKDNDGDMYGAVTARVSPSGQYVVCSTIRSYAVYLFERNPSTGALKVLDKVKEGENGANNLVYLPDVAFSPDSRFVYVVADHSAALTVFRLTEDKKLALVECTKGDKNCFDGARHFNLSPDGKHLYVASWQANALVVLERDAQTGRTQVKQVVRDEEGGVHGLAGAFYVCCSPDGRFVYTSAGRFGGDNAICVFQQRADGTVELVQEVFDGQGGVTGFTGGNKVLVSRDGSNLYALGSQSNSIVVFTRDVSSGKLTYLQTFYDSKVAGADGSASGIALSPDDEHLYVAGEFDSSLLIFKRLTGTKREPADALHRAVLSGDISRVKSLIAGGADVNARAGAGWTPLHTAVRSGNKEMAESLISAGADLNAVNTNNGLTPLVVAAMSGRTDMVELLARRGADVNKRNSELDTPLHLAARDGDPNVVDTLVRNGADVHTKNNSGDTPLHYASMYGQIPIASLLLERGADINAKSDPGWTPLLYAARAGNRGMIQLLLSKGADVNAGLQGYTPLSFAIGRGDKDMAELLIAKVADVNARRADGETPLHEAASAGRKEVVELLIARGADVNRKDRDGGTPLWYAKIEGHAEVVELLLKHGARDEAPANALHKAAAEGNVERVRSLIESGADVNAKDPNGLTPLHRAVFSGNRTIVELLLSHGADINAQNSTSYYWTPLHFAAGMGQKELVEFLLAKGADIKARTANNSMPLHRAALEGHKDVVEVLIAKGADVNAKTTDGDTALDLAKQRGHSGIVELLQKHGAKE
jgi:ankyrin repeat protein/beta-lactamase regulating signal transducer with metallopeptidase domain/6-phosphogluconolactonase (cycloisomerase 2 family)